jgi:hypothetical protein
MRATLDIDDDLLRATKQRARAERKTAGQLVSELLRQMFTQSPEPLDIGKLEIVDGIPVLPSRGYVVTPELIDRLIEEADMEDAAISLDR